MNHQLNVNLINRRLNSYGDLYILLSDFIKKTNCLGSFYPTEISNSEISEFLSKFKEKDSELSLIFSSYTGKVMRIFQNVLIHLMKDQNNQTPCNIKKAGMVARELEKAMRSDIGIYGMKYDGGEIKPEEPIKIPPELQELLNNEKEDW